MNSMPSIRAYLCAGHVRDRAVAVGRARAPRKIFAAATPGQLPKTVVPIHYALDLQPDLDKLDRRAEAVRHRDPEPTDRLVLNADNITSGEAAPITDDTKAATDHRPMRRPRPSRSASGARSRSPAQACGRVFRASTAGRGLFLVDLPDRRGPHADAVEPPGTRRTPAASFRGGMSRLLGQIFELPVTVPEHFSPVSNMPIAREEFRRRRPQARRSSARRGCRAISSSSLPAIS